MKIAIVTPYYREDLEQLARCHESVRAQTVPVSHIMVADGFPRPEAVAWADEHLSLPRAHGDYGTTPRVLGAALAKGRGFDAIQYLDADCWLRPHHIETMLDLQARAQVDFVTASRSLYGVDGSELFHLDPESDGDKFCDTNCMFFTRPAFWTIGLWYRLEPKDMILGDKIVWGSIRGRIKTAHCREPTVCYTSTWHFHYSVAGQPAPAGAKLILHIEGEAVIAWYDHEHDYFTTTRKDGSQLVIPHSAIVNPEG